MKLNQRQIVAFLRQDQNKKLSTTNLSILSCLKQMCPHILMKPLSIKKSICKVQDLREIINRVKSLKGEFKNLLFKLTKLGSK